MNDTNEPDENMTAEEREMMAMLNQDEGQEEEATQAGQEQNQEPTQPVAPDPVPETKPVEAHPVDVGALEASGSKETPDKDSNLKLIMDIPVEIKVEVGNARLSIREVLNLAPGAIIELDRTAGSPADLIVNGTSVGQGDVVVVDESYGIRITKLVKPEDRLNSL